MFWYLTLAHLIADYPLQPDWMVRSKRKWRGLTLHVSVHLIVMVILVGGATRQIWFYLLAVAVMHYGIDTFKNILSEIRPEWMIGPYVFDQILHFLSLLLVAFAISRTTPPGALPPTGPWLVVSIGVLFASYVWFISERILAYANEAYQRELAAQSWQRMLGRLLLLVVILVLWNFAAGSGRAFWAPGSPWLAVPLQIPYIMGVYRRRAFIVDLSVALVTAVFIQLAS